MPVFRVERNKGYTVMSNYHLRDKSLSLRVCLKTFDKRGREVDNKGKTGGR